MEAKLKCNSKKFSLQFRCRHRSDSNAPWYTCCPNNHI